MESGERLCSVGPTALANQHFSRLLSGVEEPDSGRIILPKDCRLGYVWNRNFRKNALEMPLMDYVLDVVHDWNDFGIAGKSAAKRKRE